VAHSIASLWRCSQLGFGGLLLSGPASQNAATSFGGSCLLMLTFYNVLPRTLLARASF
jgi:hypothetical protein